MGRRPVLKNRKKSQEKREKWVKECIEHFEKVGIRNVTMDDVADKLQVSKATIYNHFHSKEEIIVTAIDMILQNIRVYKDILNDESIPFTERYFQALKHYVYELTMLPPVLVRDVKLGYPKMWRKVEDFRNEFGAEVRKYYERGIKEDYFKNIDIDVMVLTDRWFLENIVTLRSKNIRNFDFHHLLKEYYRLKFDGIINSSGASFLYRSTTNLLEKSLPSDLLIGQN